MQCPLYAPICGVFCHLILAATTTIAAGGTKARIELELVTERGFPVTGSHEWQAALTKQRLDFLRIRAQRGTEKPEINVGGTDAAPTYYVKGVLTARNQLRLPGATFGLRDKNRLADWLSRLSAGGKEGLSSKRLAFGLTSRQLVDVRDALSKKLRSETKEKNARQIIRSMLRDLSLKTSTDPAIGQLVSPEHHVADELEGVSSGTALAAILRPFGLALVPEKDQGGMIRLRIIRAASVREFWPVGWPPEKKTRELIPKFFEFLEVEIVDTPLGETLEAIQGRLDVPMLMDHNAFAKHRIDPSRINVSFPLKRTFYKNVLDRVLTQAQLRAELRVDEAGQPFLWITSVRP